MKKDINAWAFHKPISEIDVIGRLRIPSAGDGMPFETHDDAFELLLLESGSKSITVENQNIEMRGGDMLLLPPGKKHGAPHQVQNKTSMLYVLFPDPAQDKEFLGLTPEERSAISRFLYAEAPLLCHVHTKVQKQFASLFHSCKPSKGELVCAVRRAHFSLLLEGYQRCVHSCTCEISPEIARVLRQIDAERDRIPSVSELAAWAFLSESRFKQKFHQQLGMPPMEYVLRHKLQEAVRILESREISLPYLASTLGFSSDKHFFDVFRRYMGCSPAQYLRKNG